MPSLKIEDDIAALLQSQKRLLDAAADAASLDDDDVLTIELVHQSNIIQRALDALRIISSWPPHTETLTKTPALTDAPDSIELGLRRLILEIAIHIQRLASADHAEGLPQDNAALSRTQTLLDRARRLANLERPPEGEMPSKREFPLPD